MDNNDSQVEADTTGTPEGYVHVMGPDGLHYMVPEFFAADLNNTLDGLAKKKKLEIEKAAGTVRKFNSSSFGVIGEGMIMAPNAPGSSDRERLSAHAEVLALQERLGISYKDASHRLYMAEMKRLKADEQSFKAFTTLKATTKKALEKAYNAVKEIENLGSEDIDSS